MSQKRLWARSISLFVATGFLAILSGPFVQAQEEKDHYNFLDEKGGRRSEEYNERHRGDLSFRTVYPRSGGASRSEYYSPHQFHADGSIKEREVLYYSQEEFDQRKSEIQRNRPTLSEGELQRQTLEQIMMDTMFSLPVEETKKIKATNVATQMIPRGAKKIIYSDAATIETQSQDKKNPAVLMYPEGGRAILSPRLQEMLDRR